jgi:hypothetical protein
MTTINKELNAVRVQADELGITYHHRAGVDKIQGLIDSFVPGLVQVDAEETTAPAPAVAKVQGKLPRNDVVPMDPAEYRRQVQARKRQDCNRLIRCRIQCMNPLKKDWPGEIISTGSAKLGTFKKYIPFNSPEPYHIPKIIHDVLLEKRCSVFYNETSRLGHQVRKSRLVPEYAIEVLEPLTKEALSELARTQAMAAGQGE